MKLKMMMRWMSVLCAVVVLFAFSGVSTVHARTTEEIQAEINEKKNHLNELEQRIKASKEDRAKAQQVLAEYQTEYNNLLELIEEKELSISHRENEVAFKTEQISNTIENINQNRALFATRLRAIYDINNSNAMLASLLHVSSYSDYALVSDSIQRISKSDTEMMEELSASLDNFESQKVDLETALEQLGVDLKALQEDREWCNQKMTEMKGQIAVANADIADNIKESKDTEAEVAALQQEYARVFAAQEAKSSRAGDSSVRYDGPLKWPVSGGGKVTSWFGDPRSNTGYHYGIDITGSAGTPILAAASGTVITAEWHYSYGYYVVIDHGQGLRTLYAHNSALHVSAGQGVETGTQIASMGSTGDSYGNHLHFEVHEHGTRQNPAGSAYLNIS